MKPKTAKKPAPMNRPPDNTRKAAAPGRGAVKVAPRTYTRPEKPSLPPQALHSSSKSGYAFQVMPERASPGMAGSVIPVGSPSGGQAGRIPPAQRQYNAHYEVVDAAEAQARMIKRIRGEMPTIKGGLDESGFDDAGIIESGDSGLDPFSPAPQAPQPTAQQIEPEQLMRYSAPPKTPPSTYNPQAQALLAYMGQRKRVTLELPDTTVSVNAVDVILSKYCVTVLLPTSGDTPTFTPKPATELTVEFDGKSVDCYYPGANFIIEPLHVLGLTFIRREEG